MRRAAALAVTALTSLWPLALHAAVPAANNPTSSTYPSAFFAIFASNLLLPAAAVILGGSVLPKSKSAFRLAIALGCLAWLEASLLQAWANAPPPQFGASFGFFAFMLLVPAAVGSVIVAVWKTRQPRITAPA